MDRSLVVLDTETATLRGAPHLLEIGAVRVVEGDAAGHFQELVRCDVPVEPEASDIHGIVQDDLRTAGDPEVVLAAFREFVGDAWMVAHNVGMDAHVLGFAYARAGIDPPAGVMLDSVALAKRCFPDAPDHKLPTLVEHLGIEAEGLHRALPDAVACWQVVDACVEHLGGWAELSAAGLLEHCGTPYVIAERMPRAPRRNRNRVQALERAAREGADVVLVYGDEDDAPSRLSVAPRLCYELSDRGYLEGECLKSGMLKTYRLDRIRRIEA